MVPGENADNAYIEIVETKAEMQDRRTRIIGSMETSADTDDWHSSIMSDSESDCGSFVMVSEAAPATDAQMVVGSETHAEKEKEAETALDRSNYRLKVLTWNIWFEPLEVFERMTAIANIIQKESPDIVALQEVTTQLECVLFAMPALSAYREVPAPRSSAPYYTLLLAHKKLQWQPGSGLREPFPSSSDGRDRLVGRLEWCGIPLQVTNVHLESPDAKENKDWSPDDKGSTERRRQLTKVLEDLNHDDDSLVLGDFNSIRQDGPFPSLPLGATDVWETLNPKDKGLTFDAPSNGCVRSSYRGRPDRVLFGARLLSSWTARLVGTDAIPAASQPSGRPVLPSDHFGLFVTFRLSPTPDPLAGWTLGTSTVEQPVLLAEIETTTVKADELWECACGFKNRSQNMLCGGWGQKGCKMGLKPGLSKIEFNDNCQVKPPLPDGPWLCPCGFVNRRAGNAVCGGIGGKLGCKKPKPAVSPQGYYIGGLHSPTHWQCICGFKNAAANSVCGGVHGEMGCKLLRTVVMSQSLLLDGVPYTLCLKSAI